MTVRIAATGVDDDCSAKAEGETARVVLRSTEGITAEAAHVKLVTDSLSWVTSYSSVVGGVKLRRMLRKMDAGALKSTLDWQRSMLAEHKVELEIAWKRC